jgi:uncharacterized damage-inducible protein DinB
MYRKPQPGDYPPYYEKYFAQLPQVPVMDLLEQQWTELRELLSGLSEEQAQRPYAAGKWNTKQVLGHLMDTERIKLYRALCIGRGEEQPLPGYDENAYVAQGGFSERTLNNLLQEYELVRQHSLAFFQHLAAEAFNRRGRANHSPMTVRAILTVIVAHERHHLNLFKERYLPVWI